MNNLYLTKTKNFAYTNKQENMPFVLSNDLVDDWVKEHKLEENQTKDFTTELEDARYRVHLFHSLRGWNAALRLLPLKILEFNELGINSEDILSISKGTGLTLFCGATGSGKSTTMNTAIDSLLKSSELGVTITVEDPIEYLHQKDIIFQREVGTDVASFEQGLIDAVRANPTTIIIGEIRDSKTALEAVRAGLNGHRVLATLHASNVQEAISRLWAFLDDQGDELLVQSLQGIVAQHLVHISSDKTHCIYETLAIDNKAKNLLNQVLQKGTNLVQLNQLQFNQGRLSLVDKKKQLINEGIDKALLYCISD